MPDRSTARSAVAAGALLLLSVAALGADAAEISARRRAVAEKVREGLVLVHSKSSLSWDESSFRQTPSFYYLTGLVNAHEAILAIDAGAKDSWLFVGKPSPAVLYRPELRGFDAIYIEPGAESERALGIEHVVPWDRFISFVESRRAKSPKLPMYVESGGFTGGLIGRSSNPPEMAPVENLYVLWQRAVQERWPDAEIRDATPVVEELRAVKSDGEIALLTAAAEQTAAAFWAGAAAIRPGRTTREVEAEVVRACVQKGAQGPSFWPWVRAGVSAGPTAMFQAMADYRNSSSAMAAGELVRLDVGCEHRSYKGDFGRTIPVSGKFTQAQSETLDFLNRAYLAGVGAMRPGSKTEDVYAAMNRYILDHRTELRGGTAREAFAGVDERSQWFLHGLGLDLIETAPAVFRAGNVLCFEPRVTVGAESFFVEDTFLITPDGHRTLSPALPYLAAAIVRELATRTGGAGRRTASPPRARTRTR